MKKVAVFGNTGGGKSTLSQRLSDITDLPLYVLDKIKYQPGGIEIPEQDYKLAHERILATDQWIIDGFGSLETIWLQLQAADSLIYIDLPLSVHFWWVTKRLLKGLIVPPAGWPEHSPLLKSSINSYHVLWQCHKHLTPRYRAYIEQAQQTKHVYHLRSRQQIVEFWKLFI